MPLKPTAGVAGPHKGRGATTNLEGRFETWQREGADDGWARAADEEEPRAPQTVVASETAKSIIARNRSPDIPFTQSINPYRGCEHGCVYCLDGDTAILMGDGSTKPLAELRPGDEIYGTVKRGHYRRYVRTTVLAHWQTVKPAFRIRLADGTELIASADHRFLTGRGWKYVAPAARGSQRPFLTTSNTLMGFGAIPIPAGERHRESDEYRQGYLCGVIRGDGDLGVHRYSREGRRHDDEHRSRPAVIIESQAVESAADLRVASIEPLANARTLFDITTGTGDFIANGVVSHNCYARPTHAYLGLSPGLDFETRLVAKTNAPALLRDELARPSYRCESITIGANTDPYQPIEREYRLTRGVIEVLAECEHPFHIITKNALVERDIDLIAAMAAKRLARVFISVTNWDPQLARRLEPRASAPYRRIEAIRRLAAAGIPVGVMVAPVIPFITDRNLEEVLERAAAAGASAAGYVLLRLPHEISPIFREWLATHYKLKADHVMSLVQQMRGGKDYDARFGTRLRGTGNFADLIAKRFELACARLGLNRERDALDTTRFRPPRTGPQMELF